MGTMKNIYQSLLLVIAGATHKELARHIKYLKVENEILRSRLPLAVRVTAQERNRLVKFGCKLMAKVVHQLVSTVHLGTLLLWIRENFASYCQPTDGNLVQMNPNNGPRWSRSKPTTWAAMQIERSLFMPIFILRAWMPRR
jgi:hypothetical protein